MSPIIDPGPPKPNLASLDNSIKRLEEAQADVRAKLAGIKAVQSAHKQLILSLSN